jgi:diguanylate cyclase (GGDEF)-like protein/putative nucleotidyltransferase with HDIG domain
MSTDASQEAVKAETAPPEHRLPRAAKVFIWTIGLAGAAGTLLAFFVWPPDFSPQFLLYLVLAVAGSRMKVPFPDGTAAMSVGDVMVMLGLLQLSIPETLILAITGMVTQTIWQKKHKLTLAQFFFNITSIALAVLAAACAFQLRWFSYLPENEFLRLSLAGTAYFAANIGLLAMIISLAERRKFRAVWSSFSNWTFLYYLIAAALAELVHMAIRRLGWSFTLALLPLLYAVYRSCKVYFEKLDQERAHAQNMAALHLRTIEALAMAIEAKDECTHEHLRRVQVYSLELGKQLGLPDGEMQALQAASILHDIGKLAVPDYIISKPGKLTPDEFDKMKVHTIVGADILEQVAFPYAVAPIVRSHHEKWDGTGYPDGLVGEQIPIGARILSAVDCLDALASDRQYRRALPLDDAMNYVDGLGGKSFDPKIIAILKQHYREFERLAQSTPFSTTRLKKDVVVSRGDAPDAGYEKNQAAPAANAVEAAEAAAKTVTSVASSRRGMQAILELAQDAGGTLRPEELFSLAAERLKFIVPYDCVAIYVRHGDVLRPRYVNGENSSIFSSLEIPFGEGLSGWVAENGKPIVNGNPSVEPGYAKDSIRAGVLNSALSIPLRDTSEHISGALTLYRAEKDAYTKEHLRILLAISDKIARLVELALKLGPQEDANHDDLTGLPNADSLSFHFQRELVRCEAQGNSLALLACDLDSFKQVNDRYGSISGDELLKRVASILLNNCRASDFVARAGGDEFMVVFAGADANELAGRIETLDWKVREAGRELLGDDNIGISVGLACFPENGSDADTLLAYAERDMERSKQARRNGDASLLQLARSVK